MALSRTKSLVAMFALLLAAWFLTACGQAVNPAYRDTAKIPGAWHVTSPVGIDTFIVQDGGSYSAQNVSAPLSCVDGGTMTGSAQGDIVTLTFVSPFTPADSLTLTGTHSKDTIIGNQVVATGSCDSAPSFSAQHIGSVTSDHWSGSLDGTTAITVTSQLTVDTLGNATGTLTFSGSSCLTSANVTGWQLGDELILTDGNASSFYWEGIVNSNGKGIAGTYGGTCGSGTFTMTR